MSPEDRKRPPAAPGRLGRLVDDFRRSPVRTKVLLVLANVWLAVCVALAVLVGFGGEAGRPRKDEGGRMKAEGDAHPSSFRIHPSEAHDWLADFGDDFGAEFRKSMAARKVLAPAEAESFQRNDLPELAFAAIDEPIPEAPAERYVEPDFPDWTLPRRGEAEGDIEIEEDEGEEEKAAADRETVRETAGAGVAPDVPAAERPEGAASRGKTVSDPDALLSPLPRVARRRLVPRGRRPMTREDQYAAASILKTLGETRSGYRQNAASAQRVAELGRLAPYDDPAVSRSMLFLARDPDPRVRRALVVVLAGHDNVEAAGGLLFILGLGDPVTELGARAGLASLRDEETVRWLYSRALPRGASGTIRSAVADALGRIGEERAIPSLMKALRDVDGGVRASAALALGRLRVAEAADSLARLTRDRDARVRSAVCLSLGCIRDPGSVPALAARLKDRDANVRSSAARALGALRSAETVGALIEALAREPSRVRDDVIRALTLTTGMRYGDDVGQWRKWWELCSEGEGGAGYEVPTLELAAAALEEMEVQDVDYYGIRTRSTRIIFLVDVSGSMAGAKIEAAKAELQKTLGGFTQKHFFNMIFFSSGVRSWKGHLVQATARNLAQASGYIYRLRAEGMTNAYGALTRALKDPNVDTIFLLSDGHPTAGRITDPDAIRSGVRKMNSFRRIVIHCIGIGGHDREFMKGLAEDNGGRYVTPGR